MKEQDLKPKYNRLFMKTYISFAAVITIFALLLGVLYMRMYEGATVENFEQQQTKKAQAIAKRCSTYFLDNQAADWMDYLILLSELEGTEIWPISNPDAAYPLSNSMATSLDTETLTQDYVELARAAFSNKIQIRNQFSAYHECDIVTVGVPVQGVNGETAGAILLISPVETQKEVVNSSWYMIFMSSLVALMVSFVIAIPFARNLSQPITSMRSTALELAAGNYETKTGIARYDEIGELATTIDFLADKLAANEIERKNMEQMRLDFFANVSHELRTPITVVRGYTESLVDGVVSDEERRQKYYQRMLSECQSMERLVGDLLLLSKMQNPDFLIEKEPVTLQQVFYDIKRTAWAIADERNIEIIVKQPEEPCIMMADYVRLRQMFVVIVDNAVKFSPDNSRVHITIEESDAIRVSIQDEGIGITEEELPHIFEKFYKSKLRQNAKGSGLGLAIARQICLKHDGTIQVQSKAGKGTVFIFTFPKMEKRITC